MNFPRKILVRPNLPGKGAIGDEKARILLLRGASFAEHVFDTARASCGKELVFWKDISEGYEGTNLAMFAWWPRVYLIRDEKQDPRVKEPYRGDVIMCDAKKIGDYLELPAASGDGSSGMFVGRYWLVAGPDHGIVKILVGDNPVQKSVDLYADEVQPLEIGSAAPIELSGGPKTVRIEVVGKNEDSKGMKFGLYAHKVAPALILPEAWNIIGPFPFDIKSDDLSFDKAWPPERELKFDAKYEGKYGEVAWTEMPLQMVSDDDYQAALFRKGIPRAGDVVAYMHTHVESPSEAEMTLKIGHSRSLAIFLNGEKVYEKITQRPFKPDQESAKVRLKKGPNSLLVKTANGRGLWKVGLKFVDAEGKLVPGLRFVKELEEE
jgi:hypothetical protein